MKRVIVIITFLFWAVPVIVGAHAGRGAFIVSTSEGGFESLQNQSFYAGVIGGRTGAVL